MSTNLNISSTPSKDNLWQAKVKANPQHSTWYRDRFRAMAAAGEDIVGEARLIDAMAPRNAHILDAGCGGGRLGGYLAQQGHTVVGVDVDPVLIEAAEQDHPGPRWIVADLAELNLSDHGSSKPFDLIVCAGNVVTFLAPSTRPKVLADMAAHLADNGRVVVGFGAGRGYNFDTFLSDAAANGLEQHLLLASWDLQPFTPGGDFLVAVFTRVQNPSDG